MLEDLAQLIMELPGPAIITAMRREYEAYAVMNTVGFSDVFSKRCCGAGDTESLVRRIL